MSEQMRISGATKRYENGVYGLRGIRLTLYAGDRIAILGRNGSGKSSLLKALTGEIELTSGSIWFGEKNLTRQKIHRRMIDFGYVPQKPGTELCPNLTLEEHCYLASTNGISLSSLLPWKSRSKKSDYLEAISELGLRLGDRLTSTISEFSGGEQQMIAVLLAYLRRNSVLLLDEHTSALDPIQRGALTNTMEKFHEQTNATIVFVTHSIQEALDHSTRIVILENGAIKKSYSGFEKEMVELKEIENVLLHIEGDPIESI